MGDSCLALWYTNSKLLTKKKLNKFSQSLYKWFIYTLFFKEHIYRNNEAEIPPKIRTV